MSGNNNLHNYPEFAGSDPAEVFLGFLLRGATLELQTKRNFNL